MTEHNSQDTSKNTSGNLEQDILKGRDLIRSASLNEAKELLSSLLDSVFVDSTLTESTSEQDSPLGYIKLQLANTYLYLQNYSLAITFVDSMIKQAKEDRDALLTIAALVTKGEAIIDMVTFDSDNDEIQPAIEAFGKALGVSEFFDDEKMTVLPLAGLAHSHWLWGNSKKAIELCERSQVRAEAIQGDERELLKARAALSHAITQQSTETFQKAIEQASVAQHISLKNRIERFYKLYKSNFK